MVKVILKEKIIKRSRCLFCSLGCAAAIRVKDGQALAIDYDQNDPVSQGALCARGYYNFELLGHPQRMTRPQVDSRITAWDEAVDFSRQQLREFDGGSIAIALSGNASNEDAVMAARLAGGLGTLNIAAAGNPFDQQAYAGSCLDAPGAAEATLDEIAGADHLLIIGDILRRSPVLSWRINKVKYGKRGNRVTVVDPNPTHTSWFATSHLKINPGMEALLLLTMIEIIARENGQGELGVDVDRYARQIGLPATAIMQAAKEFHASAAGVIVFAPNPYKQRNDLVNYFARLLSSLSPGKKTVTFYGFGNTIGVNRVLDKMVPGHISYDGLMGRIEAGQINALVCLGDDIAVSHPDRAKKFLPLKFNLLAGYFARPADASTALFPLASHLEQSASYVLSGGRREELSPVADPVGGVSIAELCARLLGDPIDQEKLIKAAAEAVIPAEAGQAVVVSEKVEEAEKLLPQAIALPDDITHFGNNDLARHFFWYRVNNQI